MKARNWGKKYFLLAMFCLFVGGASVAQASPDGHAITLDQWINLLWRIATVVLVLAVIWRFAGKKALSFFRGRREGIAQELQDFEARKEDARKQLHDVERRIANLDEERQAILDEYTARAEAMAQDIINKAEERAALIMTQARQTATNEIDQALVALRSELAESIAQATQERLAASLSDEQHAELIESSLNKVVLQ